MTPPLPRRDFLKMCGLFGMGCACVCDTATAVSAEETQPASTPNLPALKCRSHCGLTCDDHCQLYKASMANDVAAKKEIFEQWHWREKYGIEFDADKVFCFGCKPKGRPRGLAVSACAVRACSVDRGLESCLQCRRLGECAKSLWQNWPEFKRQMLELQRTYVAAGVFKLV